MGIMDGASDGDGMQLMRDDLGSPYYRLAGSGKVETGYIVDNEYSK